MLYKLDWLMPKCASLNLIWECFSWANLNADVHREDDKPTLTQVRGLVFNRTPPNLSPTLLSKAFPLCCCTSTTSNTWHAPRPFHLVRQSSVRQQVTPDNLIPQPSEKQAPTNTCPRRTYLALPLAGAIPGLKDVSEGRCHAGCFDDDPEDASAALGRQGKQAGFPRDGGGCRELRLPMLLMLQ